MAKIDGRKVGQQMVEAVKSYVARSASAWLPRLYALENAVVELKTMAAAPKDGANGASAYDLALKNGFEGSQAEWLRDLRGKDGKDAREPKDGRDGHDGRDAADIHPLAMIDPERSYGAGTWAKHAGGLWVARSTTTGMDGWDCVVCGIAAIDMTFDGERELAVKCVLSDGKVSAQVFKFPSIIYRQVWTEGEYERGDVVTWGGSAWHCEAEKTTDKPGTSQAWRLMVKEGARGKDGKSDSPAAPRVPVRLK